VTAEERLRRQAIALVRETLRRVMKSVFAVLDSVAAGAPPRN
jgi:hypothetical protein